MRINVHLSGVHHLPWVARQACEQRMRRRIAGRLLGAVLLRERGNERAIMCRALRSLPARDGPAGN